MPDPDLEIRGGGQLSRPLDNGEPGLQKNFFPVGPQFGLKVRGGGAGPRAPPLDPPLSADGLSIHEPIEPKI